ncbi:MAG: hypothetical protein HRT47_03560 [Candidatus Caenarcaniphilales bacterium]|nr:hypothetical protein [Candidatus Caenarcaniphilales bacterium]
MCPNCVLNSAGAWSYLGPGLICFLFLFVGVFFFVKTKEAGEFDGDSEEAKYEVFDD